MESIRVLLIVNKNTLIATAIVLVLSFAFVELSASIFMSLDQMFLAFFAILLMISIPVILGYTVSYAILNSIKTKKKSIQLESVVLSYFCLIMSFSGFYYYLASFGDFNESVSEYHYYESMNASMFEKYVSQGIVKRSDSERSFKGIEQRMWSGLAERVPIWPSGAEEPPIMKLVEAAQHPKKRVIEFNTEARLPVLVDSIYFSVATITTLGFGDITPRSIYAKIFSIFQVLAGLALVVVGVGLSLRTNEP